ncbi:hypothetical protein D3C73_826140 [compost metagenome]
MSALHPEFTVNRKEVFRFHQVEHKLQFFLAPVSRYVNTGIGSAVNYVGAQPEQFINGTADIFLIAWYRGCRNNYGVARQDVNFAVTGARHTGKRRHRLTLAACAQYHYAVASHSVHFFRLNQHAVWNVEIPKLGSNGYYIDHTASDNGNLASRRFCSIYYLLDTMHVGSEGCNHHTLFGFAENVLQNDADILLRRSEARLLSICAV